MPPVSNYSSRREWENACWRKISESGDLLQILTTSHERHDLVMRAATIDSIKSGKSYRETSKELQISLQTISGVKKAINEKGYRSYLERSKTERKKKSYSSNSSRKKKEPYRHYRRTKYGKVYTPY